MTRPLTTLYDGITQERIEREMNDEEYAQYEIDKAQFEEKEAIKAAERAELDALAAAKAAAKAELLATLNLSQETLDLLNGLN
jgi:hypothetical protein